MALQQMAVARLLRAAAALAPPGWFPDPAAATASTSPGGRLLASDPYQYLDSNGTNPMADENANFTATAPQYVVFSTLGIVACVMLLVVAVRLPATRKTHTTQMILMVAVCDLLFAIKFWVTSVLWLAGYTHPYYSFRVIPDNCASSAAFEYFVEAGSNLWNAAFAFDFWCVLRNPLRSTRSNMPIYHGVIWSLLVLQSAAVASVASIHNAANPLLCFVMDPNNVIDVLLIYPIYLSWAFSILSVAFALSRLLCGSTHSTRLPRIRLLGRYIIYVFLFVANWLWAVLVLSGDFATPDRAMPLLRVVGVFGAGGGFLLASVRLLELWISGAISPIAAGRACYASLAAAAAAATCGCCSRVCSCCGGGAGGARYRKSRADGDALGAPLLLDDDELSLVPMPTATASFTRPSDADIIAGIATGMPDYQAGSMDFSGEGMPTGGLPPTGPSTDRITIRAGMVNKPRINIELSTTVLRVTDVGITVNPTGPLAREVSGVPPPAGGGPLPAVASTSPAASGGGTGGGSSSGGSRRALLGSSTGGVGSSGRALVVEGGGATAPRPGSVTLAQPPPESESTVHRVTREVGEAAAREAAAEANLSAWDLTATLRSELATCVLSGLCQSLMMAEANAIYTACMHARDASRDADGAPAAGAGRKRHRPSTVAFDIAGSAPAPAPLPALEPRPLVPLAEALDNAGRSSFPVLVGFEVREYIQAVANNLRMKARGPRSVTSEELESQVAQNSARTFFRRSLRARSGRAASNAGVAGAEGAEGDTGGAGVGAATTGGAGVGAATTNGGSGWMRRAGGGGGGGSGGGEAPTVVAGDGEGGDNEEPTTIIMPTSGISDTLSLVTFAERTFVALRKAAGLSTAHIVSVLDPALLHTGGLHAHFSNGASASFFCRSADATLIVKTIAEEEVEQLLRLLPAYHRHLTIYPDSLLCRFYGLWGVKLASFPRVFFVMMGNAFPIADPGAGALEFDLKGSWSGRRCRSKGGGRRLLLDQDFVTAFPGGVAVLDSRARPGLGLHGSGSGGSGSGGSGGGRGAGYYVSCHAVPQRQQWRRRWRRWRRAGRRCSTQYDGPPWRQHVVSQFDGHERAAHTRRQRVSVWLQRGVPDAAGAVAATWRRWRRRWTAGGGATEPCCGAAGAAAG